MMILSVLCLSFQWPTYTKRIVYIYHELLLILIYTIYTAGGTVPGVAIATSLEQKNKYSPRIRNSERKPTNAIASYFTLYIYLKVY